MNYRRRILEMDDVELEQFSLRWVKVMTSPRYHLVERFSDAGDMGRDVVGFLTDQLHEGPWHNFQCKQLGRNLNADTALVELGKIIHFSNQGCFILPEEYTFVAPRGLSRPLEELIFNPSKLKQEIIDKWGSHCAKKIEKGKTIPLDAKLLTHLKTFNFHRVRRVSVDHILSDDAAKPVMAAFFGIDPGAPPKGEIPADVAPTELRYAGELFHAYGDHDSCTYGQDDVLAHKAHGPHFAEQRERFYAADAFRRFYRDNTLGEETAALEDEIYHGVIQKHREPHASALARVEAVLGHAATIAPTGPLAGHARVQVRQGICHHLVNDERIKSWK